MKFEDLKTQIKKHIDESKTYGELFCKVVNLYMRDGSVPTENKEKVKEWIRKSNFDKIVEVNDNAEPIPQWRGCMDGCLPYYDGKGGR